MAMTKRQKFKFLLTIEILTIALLAVVLFFTLKMKDINRQDIDKDNLSIKKDIKGFTNIMLFGVDARESAMRSNSGDTRSDTMILVTINEKTKDVTLTSFYRDYYAYSPHKAGSTSMDALTDKCFDKLTHGYTKGPEEAIKSINMNFDLDVSHYVTVNFIALVRVVDQLGGIELNVKNNAMISEINKYGGEIARKNGESFKKVTKTGVQLLDGYQSLGYARTRKRDSDFNRAQRQREVINKILEKVKSGAGITKLQSIYESITKNMVTNFTNAEILSMLKDVTKYNIRKETNTGYGNGYPYHVSSFTYKGMSSVFSEVPYTDISLLHYNLFNNGVLPEQLQSSSSEGGQATTDNPAPTEEGLGYVYTPTDDVLKITNYLTNIYNENAPQ
ncbi:MAG: LytR family transcriptional regulator [Lachnospiraceae bacterium]|nr:LytR family transcriptional regulator [Lachnospiraceae bacterium]